MKSDPVHDDFQSSDELRAVVVVGESFHLTHERMIQRIAALQPVFDSSAQECGPGNSTNPTRACSICSLMKKA